MSNSSSLSGWFQVSKPSAPGGPSSSSSASSAAAKNTEPLPKQSDVKDVKTFVPSYVEGQPGLLASPAVVREMLVQSGKAKKGKSIKGAPVYRCNVVYHAPITGDVNGDAAFLTSSQLLATCSDFKTLAGLFETVRVRGVHMRYQPISPGANLPSTGKHVPFALVVDPSAVGASTYTTVVGTRDWSDEKNNLFTNTGTAFKHFFPFPHRAITTGSGTLGDWNLVSSYNTSTNVFTGGVECMIKGAVANSGIDFGDLLIVFDCEWSYRV